MSRRAVDLLMFSSYLFFIFSGLALFLTSFASLNRICILYTLEEAKRFSLVKMSATDSIP